MLDKVFDEQGDIGASVPQRGQLNGEHVQAVIEIFPEAFLLNREAKIPVCCRYHPNRDFHGPASPDPLESAVLQHP